MSFSISPLRLTKWLGACIALLAVMHALMLIADYGFGRNDAFELRTLFDLNREQNMPTLFSTLQLVLAAGLLFLLYCESRRSARGDSPYWPGLALVFMFLATDEFCELHEHLIAPVHRLLHTSGALSFAWVIPYGGIGMEMAGVTLFVFALAGLAQARLGSVRISFETRFVIDVAARCTGVRETRISRHGAAATKNPESPRELLGRGLHNTDPLLG